MPAPPADPPQHRADAGPGTTPAVRRAPLSRELVLTAALRLVDSEGLEALTMRRLGQELGRDPMALYRYAPSRTAFCSTASPNSSSASW